MANEKRLIDANALLADMEECSVGLDKYYCGYAKEFIDHATTVDAVEVVRCKDCKHYEMHKPKVLENCERNGYLIPMNPDDFCSYGERREGE